MKHLLKKSAFISTINTVIASSSILIFSSATYASCVDQVPTLSSDSSRVATSGDFSSSYPGWKAFDGSSSMWISETYKTPAWISYQFSSTKKISRYSIRYTNGPDLTSRAPKDFKLQGLSGGIWTTVDTRTNQTNWQRSETRAYSVANPGFYSRYRVIFTDDNDNRSGIVVISIGDLTLESCSADISVSCSTVSESTHCSYNGEYVRDMMFYWNSNNYFPIVYPSPGSFPYSTTNGAIVFTHEGYNSCPSGTRISLSTSLSGYATYTCP